MSTTAAPTPGVGADEAALTQAVRRFRMGDLGIARVVIGLAVIWTVFQVQEPRFLSAANLTNLMLQITAVGLISVGIVLVLLLGEIDLSVGAVSGLCGAIMAVLSVKHGVPQGLAVVAAIAAGAAIGTLHGLVASRFGVPTFVVTLAGLLGWQGAQLYVLGETGSINVPPGFVLDLTSTFFADWLGWLLAVAAITVYALVAVAGRVRRARAGLEVPTLGSVTLRLVFVAIAGLAAVAVTSSDRGVPLAAVILIAFVAGFDLLTRRTTFGRHVFAVGGNAEAARRAGIHVDAIRVSVFAIASSMAAFGGIMAASRLLAVNQGSGGGDVLLLAIAAPVIAGTSLFGGRGSVWTALLGALVIGSISNGMDLLALESSVKYMITGAVLLGAVIIDAAARQRRQQTGRV
jgi:D-xylose transport system permease protein